MTWKCKCCGYAENPDDTVRCKCGIIVEIVDTKTRNKRPFGFTVLTGVLFLFGVAGVFHIFAYTNYSYPIQFFNIASSVATIITALAILKIRPWANASFLSLSAIEVCALVYMQFGPEKIYKTSTSAFIAIVLFGLTSLVLTSMYIRWKFRKMES